MLYDYLLSTFGEDEPILLENIQYENYSKSWLFKELSKLCNDEELVWYDKGVYYIPSETEYGKSLLDVDKVIERKYIRNGDDVYGFYGGLELQNKIGLSTQMVIRPTIYTNNESTRKREVKIGYRFIILRKARVIVNADNEGVLSFLELITDVPDWYLEDEEKRNCFINFINIKKISKDKIINYISEFPDKTAKKLIESGLIYNVA